jgi:hypothetical protein
MPAEAKGTSRKAAVAFVHHVIEVLNYSAANLDATSFAEVSTRECRACQAIIERTNEIRAADGRLVGGAWRAVETTVLANGRSQLRQVQVVVDYAPQWLVESSQSKVRRYRGGRTLYTFDIQRRRGEWRVQGVRGVA